MEYGTVITGTFQRKVNRFIAEVTISNQVEAVHIRNTGRLKELLIPGVQVALEKSTNPKRKTRYSLIAVWKNGRLVNIDSSAPNMLAYEAIAAGGITEIGAVDLLKKEVTFQDSRFDLYYEQGDQSGYLEVKGVTLEMNQIAMFPDAPTKRGTKHIRELIQAKEQGYEATILFIIQMEGCTSFTPYCEMDGEFSNELLRAKQAGVRIIAYDTTVTEKTLTFGNSIPVVLK